MAITYYDKSQKYGDLKQGYAVAKVIAAICPQIDLRNPATVKFARLILGNADAIRDSIDDIATYASRSGGRLDFMPETYSPATSALLFRVQQHAKSFPTTPVKLAYVSAFLASTVRGDHETASALLLEYYEYLRAEEFFQSDSAARKEIEALAFSAHELTWQIADNAPPPKPVSREELEGVPL